MHGLSSRSSPILAARGASYHIKGQIYRACVQSLLTYGTETWAMKAKNLHSLDGANDGEMDVWTIECR